MNPSDPHHPWQRLVAAARQAPDDRDLAAPFGFSTRIAALAQSAPRPSLSFVFERLSVRALLVACALAVVSVAANYSAIAGAFEDDSDVGDPIAEVLNLAS
jgi:hypothetical protein